MSDTARSTATPASARPAPAATPASATPASATPFATPAQRLGNHCLSALLRARAAQAKLSVSHPSDAFELEADRVETLRAAVGAVDAHGLEVRIAPAVEAAGGAGETLDFSLVGQDRPGIVRQVTAILSNLEVNIETFETRISAEAYSGAPLFHMAARLRLPPGLAAGQVQAALEAISAEIMVDISLSPAPAR